MSVDCPVLNAGDAAKRREKSQYGVLFVVYNNNKNNKQEGSMTDRPSPPNYLSGHDGLNRQLMHLYIIDLGVATLQLQPGTLECFGG